MTVCGGSGSFRSLCARPFICSLARLVRSRGRGVKRGGNSARSGSAAGREAPSVRTLRGRRSCPSKRVDEKVGASRKGLCVNWLFTEMGVLDSQRDSLAWSGARPILYSPLAGASRAQAANPEARRWRRKRIGRASNKRHTRHARHAGHAAAPGARGNTRDSLVVIDPARRRHVCPRLRAIGMRAEARACEPAPGGTMTSISRAAR